jgi:hypothetical protein
LKLKEYGINSKPDVKNESNGKLVEGIDFDYIFNQTLDSIKAENF